MGFFFDRLFKKGKVLPANATFQITQQGKDKLGDYTGDPKSQILLALERRGTSDLHELSQNSGLSQGQVERMIPGLIDGGYIRLVTASMGDDEI